MRNGLYIISLILVSVWAIGVIGYGAGGIIHAFPVIAVMAVLFNLNSRNNRRM
jgi:hypothetical protein